MTFEAKLRTWPTNDQAAWTERCKEVFMAREVLADALLALNGLLLKHATPGRVPPLQALGEAALGRLNGFAESNRSDS